MDKKKLFLGGTCNNSTWRDRLIAQIDLERVAPFNPVVPNWTEEDYQRELIARAFSDLNVYVITPFMTGVYSIAEAVDDSHKHPEKTVFAYLTSDLQHGKDSTGKDGFWEQTFDSSQLKSLEKVGLMIEKNGAIFARSWDELIKIINE